MPTYEYACRDCGHTFETVQRMTDDPLTVCPVCGGTLRKVFAPPAIAFKGSGFYATDHRKDARSTAAGEGGGEGGKGAKEAKPSRGSKGGSEGGSKGGSDAAGAAASTPAASDGSTAKGSSS